MPSPVLTPAEVRVLCLVAEGMTDREIGQLLCISPDTVHKHCNNLYTKTGCRNRQQLTRYAEARRHVSVEWDAPER